MKVLTNVGQQEFAGIRKTEHKKYYEILFESGDILKCTLDHLFETLNGPITAKKLTKNDELIHSICGNTFIKSKKLIRRKFIAYDLVNVENGSLYYTNNVLSHNCSFLGSSNTLISGAKIQQLVFEEPIVQQKNLNIYEQPEQGHVYIATVDVAAGLSMDYSVINVIDVTEAPYKQVMVYRNNEIDPTSFSIVVVLMAFDISSIFLFMSDRTWDDPLEPFATATAIFALSFLVPMRTSSIFILFFFILSLRSNTFAMSSFSITAPVAS